MHLIHDEIAVGFGRTGTMFACEQAGIAPDFLCLSKALTGGYLPMSAVLTSETIYRGFYDDYQTLRAFLHSHTYTGNPLACAAALATLDIFEEDKVIEANRALSTHGQGHRAPGRPPACRRGAPDRDGPGHRNGPGQGVQDALPLAGAPRPEGLPAWPGARRAAAPLGSVVYFLPPYVITPEQIDFLAEVASEGIDIATRDAVSVAVSDFHPDHRDPG